MTARNACLMSPEKAGACIGVCGRTVKNWIRAGVLSDECWVKVPSGRIRVDLNALLEECSGNRSLGFRFPVQRPKRKGAAE